MNVFNLIQAWYNLIFVLDVWLEDMEKYYLIVFYFFPFVLVVLFVSFNVLKNKYYSFCEWVRNDKQNKFGILKSDVFSLCILRTFSKDSSSFIAKVFFNNNLFFIVLLLRITNAMKYGALGLDNLIYSA